jgi:hypothetical protein
VRETSVERLLQPSNICESTIFALSRCAIRQERLLVAAASPPTAYGYR